MNKSMANNEDFNTTRKEKSRYKKPTNDTENKSGALNPPVNPFDAPIQAIRPSKEETSQPQEIMIDGLGDIPAPKRQGRDTTLYLSYEVLEAVKNASSQRGISKSKIVDYALRKILLPML